MENSLYFGYQKEERKHAVPCTSMGHVCMRVVSDSEIKSLQHSPTVHTWLDGFKTKPK